MRIESEAMGYPHRVSIPNHNPMRVGTLNKILTGVAEYLELERDELLRTLFGR